MEEPSRGEGAIGFRKDIEDENIIHFSTEGGIDESDGGSVVVSPGTNIASIEAELNAARQDQLNKERKAWAMCPQPFCLSYI